MGVRRALALCGLAVCLATAGPARAVGTIDTTGATIEAGAAPSPGAVTIDPAAPVGIVPELPAIPGPGVAPTLTGSMPAPPSFGDGSGGAFTASAGSSGLVPGTHQFTSFTVTNGAAVTLSGATTILVQGSVSIAGTVISDAAGGSLAIRCGGDFTLVSRNPSSVVRTMQTSSPIEIVAGGRVLIGTDVNNLDCQVNAVFSSVSIEAHGTGAGTSGIVVKSGRVLSPGGGVTARSTGPFEMGGITSLRPGRVDCRGPLTIQSFSDRIAANSNGDFSLMNGSATLEAATQLLVGGDLFLFGQDATVTLTSVAGPMQFYTLVSTQDGDVTMRCGGDVDFFGGTVQSTGSGHVSLSAAGEVGLGGTLSSSTGDVDVVAARSVVVNGTIGSGAAANVRVSGGDFRMRNAASVQAGSAASIHATGTIDIGELDVEGKAPLEPKSATRGSDVVLIARSVDIAGGGGVTVDAATARAFGGEFLVLAQGNIAVARTISGHGIVSVRSIAGDIDVAGATVRCEDDELGGTTAVETWKPGGAIDASNGTIRSGASATASGGVSVLVHDPAAAGEAVESFILPKKLLFKTVAGKPEKTKLVASGVYDTGGGTVSFIDAATVTVGSHAFDVPAGGFVPNAKGTLFKYTSEGLRVLIVPNKRGSSRARCRVDARGAVLDGAVQPNADAGLSFRFGQSAASGGTVTLTSGKYTLGRKRGALVEPNLFPLRSTATIRGPGKDALAMVVGLATNGVTPPVAPNLHVEFGTALTLDVASASFTRKGDRYVAPGVVLDYLKESITLQVKKATFAAGAFLEGAQPVTIKVRLGGESRQVRVRMVRKGTKLFY